VLLGAAIAAGTAACSLDLDYLQNGGVDGTDASLADASVDQTSPPDAQDSGDHGGTDATTPADSGRDVSPVVDSGPPPALPPDAGTVTCPTTINGAFTVSSPTQTGRLSRDLSPSACGSTKQYPSTAPDPTGMHFFQVYRFANPTAASLCYTFTLNYDGSSSADGGDASTDDASITPPVVVFKYMAAWSTFYPSDLSAGVYLGDVGGPPNASVSPPQTMAITVPPGSTLDVVVSAVDTAPDGVDTFTLSCTAM
jgi:hypothetical protein